MSARRGAAELLRAYYAALDSGKLRELDDLFGAEGVSEFPGASTTGGANIRKGFERWAGTGLRMVHDIKTMVEQGDTAICELEATNVVGGQTFKVWGAVVCQAEDGRIKRIAAYPDASQMAPFIQALTAAGSRQ
jgi:ketosteroid isomerase-like protein